MTKSFLVIVSTLLIGIAGCANSQETGGNAAQASDKKSDPAKLIPRDVLFGNPDKAQARLSYDGKHISFIAPTDGVLNVWVAPTNDLNAAKPVTHDKKRGIRQYQWAYNNEQILYLQDEGGNENWNVHVVDLTGELRVSKQGLGQIVAQLAAGGYVETVPDPADRRAKLIRRTARGDEVTRTIRALVTRVEARWRREVGAERYAVFRAVLSELIEPPPARARRNRAAPERRG